jgi:ribosomal protein L37E
MIHVTLSQLLVIYLLLMLGGVGTIWLVRKVESMRDAWRLRKSFVICQACGNHYYDASGKTLPVCPECGRANERIPIREI